MPNDFAESCEKQLDELASFLKTKQDENTFDEATVYALAQLLVDKLAEANITDELRGQVARDIIVGINEEFKIPIALSREQKEQNASTIH